MNIKVPFRNLYSNDTTNLATCISPYHPLGGYTGRDELRESVREVMGLADVHLIQLAHGQVPWYKSKIYPFEEHLKWWSEYFGVPYKKFKDLSGGNQYIYDGGDYLADFIEACFDFGQVPFVSMRLNDEHHIEHIDQKGNMTGIHSISRFHAEHRHLMFGNDLSKWENRALNWLYPEVPEHMLSLIEEQCELYDIGGYELDFQRHPHMYDIKNTSVEERQNVTEAFISKVRSILNRTSRNGKYRYLSIRVPSNMAIWNELGLIPERMESLGVDIVNVSSYFYADHWVEREEFTKRMPNLAVYFEICHTTTRGVSLIKTGYDDFTFRRVTPNEIYSTAHLAYSAGAQGVSFFNFAYYREHGCEGRGPFNEPPFEAVGNVRDRDFVAKAPQHFFIAKGWERNSQLLRPFSEKTEYELEIYMEEPTDHWQTDFRMRITAAEELGDRTFEVFFNGEKGIPVNNISEPYEEDNDYPPLHGNEANCRAWKIRQNAVINGKNILTFVWNGISDTKPIRLNYIDIFPWNS